MPLLARPRAQRSKLSAATSVDARRNRAVPGPLRIKRFVVTGFRTCRKTAFQPAADLTALVGVNASGKSNLLQALLLLRDLVTGRSKGINRGGGTLSCQILADFDFSGKSVTYRANLELAIESGNREEVRLAKEAWNFEMFTGRSRWVELPMRYFGVPATRRRLQSGAIRARHLPDYVHYGFGYLGPDAYQFLTRRPRLVHYIRAIANFCSGISYYGASRFTNPATCPSSIEIGPDGTLRDAYNASPSQELLYDLYRCRETDSHLYDRFMSVVGGRGIGLVDQINWKTVKAPTRDVRVDGRNSGVVRTLVTAIY